MQPSESRSAVHPGPWILAVMIVLAALSRLLPHPPNFSPVEAMALFGAAHFANRRTAVWVPLAAMLVSDLALAAVHGGDYASYLGHASQWLVYGCICLTTLAGFALRGRVTGARVLAGSLAASVFFFLVTNFGAWLGNPMYPQTVVGLVQSYVAGLPFFQWTVAGTLLYAALLFGGFALLRRGVPALRAQTA